MIIDEMFIYETSLILICAMVKSRYIGDGHPTFNRNPYNGYINPYYWVDEFIPYYMEIMGVDRPWHILGVLWITKSFRNFLPPNGPNHLMIGIPMKDPSVRLALPAYLVGG